MPTLYLLIPDLALADAVREQLPCQMVLPDAPQPHDVFLVDEACADKKSLQKITQWRVDCPLTILTLGAAPVGLDAAIITENFAKPVRLGHLTGRVVFYLETAPRLRANPIWIGPYQLQPALRQLLRDAGDPIRLTEKETAILEYLAQSKDPVPREDLLAAIWGYDGRIDTHTLETHLYQLRRKLDPEQQGYEILVTRNAAYFITQGAP
ncbi:MAG: winged helix-turn-helix domain-containing protein [Alphaproteobacteria bacterium]|nr:winged helix-turn-helix domain-containing protein [Alphaproteobacteria bacterium]